MLRGQKGDINGRRAAADDGWKHVLFLLFRLVTFEVSLLWKRWPLSPADPGSPRGLTVLTAVFTRVCETNQEQLRRIAGIPTHHINLALAQPQLSMAAFITQATGGGTLGWHLLALWSDTSSFHIFWGGGVKGSPRAT